MSHAESRRSRFFIAHSVFIHGVLLAGILFGMLIYVPKWERIHEGFGTSLPALTQWLIDLAHVMSALIFVTLPAAVAVMVADAWVTWRLQLSGYLLEAFLWGVGGSILLMALGLFIIVGMFIPILHFC